MSGIPADQIPLCDSTKEHNDIYSDAKESDDVFLVVDLKEPGYTISYDLLPTGHRLTDDAHEQLDDRIWNDIEAILTDPNMDTEELGGSIGDSKGNLHFFESEQVARDLAELISYTIYDQTNWEKEPSPREQFLG